MFPYLIQGDSLTIVIDDYPHTVNKTHPAFEAIKAGVKSQDWDTVRDLIEPKKAILSFAKGNVTIEGSKLFWKHRELNTGLAQRMIAMLADGFSIDPMVAFMENLMLNPSKRAIDELYGFLEVGNLPITPDGHFLAYKKVSDNFYDVYSGTVLNAPAHLMSQEQLNSLPIVSKHDDRVTTTVNLAGLTEVFMERGLVDDDKDRTCSNGLHFCSLEYLQHFGGSKVVILKINPADVVSIPSDYNNTKGRTCRYQVLDVLKVTPEKAFDRVVQDTAVGCKPVVNPCAEQPVASPPRKGSSDFYRGYNDGYNGLGYDWNNAGKAYDEGYDKGQYRRDDGLDARYEYVAPAPAQEYDRYGRPLSMTKDAIRKRRARAAAKRS